MNAFADIINYVVSSLISVFALLVLLRFVFQIVKADFYNPISQGIVKATTPVLKPFRRLIPGVGGIDVAALVVLLLLYTLSAIITIALKGTNPFEYIGTILLISIFKLLAAFLNVATFAILASIITSFTAPMSAHPMVLLINQVAEPLMAPIRKVVPDLGPIDISPIFLFLLIGVLSRLLVVMGQSAGIPVQSMWMFVIIPF